MDNNAKILWGIIAVVVVIALVLGGIWAVSTHNKIVEEAEAVDNAWAQVSVAYERRIELIPALLDNVSGYQEFEQETLTQITALRSQWTNAETVEEQVNASNALNEAFMNIKVTYEAYPYLESSVLLSSFMDTFEGTINRIYVAELDYNNAVQTYNSHIKKFPANVIADQGGFEERSYYNPVNPDAPEAP